MALKHTNPTKPRFDRKNRVETWAVAPYNFVPLPEKMVVAQPPLDHDRYHPEPVGFSGWIDCELETCSPTYIRGMLTEKQFAEFGQAGPDQLKDEQKKEMANFFGLNRDAPVIPGSSLRGMIRQLVEIVGHGRMRYVSPVPTFTYRAVAAQADDPLRDPYREVVGAFARNVRAGFLQKRGDEWWIQPAPLPSSLNLAEKGAFLKVKERDIPGKAIPGLLRFNSPDYRPQHHPVTFDVETRRGRQGNYTGITRIGSREDGHRYQGVLVCSGNMMESGQQGQKSPRKNHALILIQDSRARAIRIDPQAVQDYRDGLTPFQEEALSDWGGKGWGCLKDGAPVFYVSEGDTVRYFGHSPNFRIPARLNLPGETRAANPRDFVPADLREKPEPDLADAMFGWVEEKEKEKGKDKLIGPPGQRAGRVFVGDARCAAGQENIWWKTEPITPHVLSGPKATTFQHYLVQDGRAPGQNGHHPDNKVALAHYGTPPTETQIRGYKLYWHKGDRPDLEANATELKHPKQLTKIKPVRAGVRFRFKVYFENLRSEELGLLWWALALPGEPGKQYRHKIGMGKPLGMGAVAISPRLFISDRTARYQTLFAGETWAEAAQPVEARPYLDALNQYLLQEQGLGARLDSVLELDRIKMLLTMLEWREGTQAWLEKTRYMEIERESGRRNETINEYKEQPVLPDPLGVVEGVGMGRGRETPPSTAAQRRETGSLVTPAQAAQPAGLQPGALLQGTVYHQAKNGDLFLELRGIDPDEMMGRIAAANLAGKKYKVGDTVSCELIAVQEKAGEKIAECRPAGTAYQSGVVAKFDAERGYGFIQPDSGGAQLFVHKNRFAPGLVSLHEGDRVQFKVGKGLKGPEAQDVSLEKKS